MSNTKVHISIEAIGSYTEKELENVCEQISNFIAGPDGEGLNTTSSRKFKIKKAKFSKPEEQIWEMAIYHA